MTEDKSPKKAVKIRSPKGTPQKIKTEPGLAKRTKESNSVSSIDEGKNNK